MLIALVTLLNIIYFQIYNFIVTLLDDLLTAPTNPFFLKAG